MNYLSRIGLADILRRAQANVGAPSQFLIVGSKSLLGSYDLDQLSGPGSEPLKSSEEVDILRLGVDTDIWYAPDMFRVDVEPDAPEPLDIVIDTVSLTTSTVPTGWADRLVPFQHPSAEGAIGWCLSPGDLFVAKAVAGRPQDHRFLAAAAQRRLITAPTIRLEGLDPADTAKVAAEMRRAGVEDGPPTTSRWVFDGDFPPEFDPDLLAGPREHARRDQSAENDFQTELAALKALEAAPVRTGTNRICGRPTLDGHPCRNPAGSCPAHR